MSSLPSSQTFPIPGSNATVQLVLIDTVLLAGLTDLFDPAVPPRGPPSVSHAESQWSWIENTLSSSTADWLLVGGHYPGGSRGYGPGGVAWAGL